MGERRIPSRRTEPYPKANREQTRHARGPVCLHTFRYIYSAKIDVKMPQKKCLKIPEFAPGVDFIKGVMPYADP